MQHYHYIVVVRKNMKAVYMAGCLAVLLAAGFAGMKIFNRSDRQAFVPGDDSSKRLPLAGANIFFDTIPFSDIDIIAPGRGANTFYSNIQSVKIPDRDSENLSLDNDIRFLWSRLQPNTEDVFKWDAFDDHLKQSIDKRQRVSFGIGTVCTTCPVYDGIISVGEATCSYPLFVHNGMQAEAVKDWAYSGTWVPNWNSEVYLSAFEKFLKALAHHIETTSYKGVSFKDVIYKIDIRGFGNWGEWHTWPWIKTGEAPIDTRPTAQSLIRIIDAHRKAFPTYPLITNIAMYVGEIPAPVGYYGLTSSNDFGKFGVRSDHLGDKGTFEYDITNNKRSYNGLTFNNEILNRWKTSPICGEPLNDATTVSRGGEYPYFDLANEVKTYHLSQFSNVSSAKKGDPDADNIFRKASKVSGYRLQLYDGIVSNKIKQGDPLEVTLRWANVGIAPVYEKWNSVIELRSTDHAKPVWSGTSAFNPRFFLPGSKTVRDRFTLPSSVDPGSYSLFLTIKDPSGYRSPLPLAIQGRNSDGSYALGKVEILRK